MIAIDTETSGSDFWHGARPYFVTTCNEYGSQRFWHWEIDPETREVDAIDEDLQEIDDLIRAADGLVGQQTKFDVHSLATVWPPFRDGEWPWDKTVDTLVAGHLLASNAPHNLTDMAIQYLGVNIEPWEKALEAATQAARRWCRSHLPTWAIAKAGRPDMPSAKEQTWKIDAWLPRTLRRLENHGPPEWDRVLEDYANADSAVTVKLWAAMEAELNRRGLWEIFAERMRIVPVIWGMEHRGITCSKSRLDELRDRYRKESENAAAMMLEIAAKFQQECLCSGMTKWCPECRGTGKAPYRLTLPKAGNNKSLMTFAFDVLGLPVVARTEGGKPSMDKTVIPQWKERLGEGTDERTFVESLETKRKKDTSISYADGYERFWIGSGDVRVLHGSINQTGTDTLRMSHQNPNSANIDKHPDNQGQSLRRIFGPGPGREWWKVDYENIELRIPAFEFQEDELVDVFNRPKDPPYFGSYHLVIFDVLHPEKFREHGKKCKELFEATWYQWVKNGNFATLYGCQEAKADQTYRVKGAYQKIRHRFPKMAAGSDRLISLANRNGYVETVPDKTVNPERGYPILCSRGEWGKISPTVPLNYHVQSTAMWCTARAMVRCDEQLREWRADGFDAFLVLQVHDELVFDLPAGGKRNLPRVRRLVKLMEESGDDIGVPLVAAAKWCPNNWAESEELT